MKALLLTFLLAQGADIATTHIGLSRGCTELNPLYRTSSISTIYVAKGSYTLIAGSVAWGAHKKGHTRMAKVILLAGIASGAGAAVWNAYQLPHCR